MEKNFKYIEIIYNVQKIIHLYPDHCAGATVQRVANTLSKVHILHDRAIIKGHKVNEMELYDVIYNPSQFFQQGLHLHTNEYTLDKNVVKNTVLHKINKKSQ